MERYPISSNCKKHNIVEFFFFLLLTDLVGYTINRSLRNCNLEGPVPDMSRSPVLYYL